MIARSGAPIIAALRMCRLAFVFAGFAAAAGVAAAQTIQTGPPPGTSRCSAFGSRNRPESGTFPPKPFTMIACIRSYLSGA